MLQETSTKKSHFTNSASNAENEANEQKRFTRFADWLVNGENDILVLNESYTSYHYYKASYSPTLDFVYKYAGGLNQFVCNNLEIFGVYKHDGNDSSYMVLSVDLELCGNDKLNVQFASALSEKGVRMIDDNKLLIAFCENVKELAVDYAWKNREVLKDSYATPPEVDENKLNGLGAKALQEASNVIWNQHFDPDYNSKKELEDSIDVNEIDCPLDELVNYFIDPSAVAQKYMNNWPFGSEDHYRYPKAVGIAEQLYVIDKAAELLKDSDTVRDLKQRDKMRWALYNTQAVNVKIHLGGNEYSCSKEYLCSALKKSQMDCLLGWYVKPRSDEDLPFKQIDAITYRGKTIFAKDKD